MATTPSRKDAYMGAMKKSEKKPTPSAPAKAVSMPKGMSGGTPASKMDARRSGGTTRTPTSKLAPETSKRPQPIGPARAIRENQAKFDRAAGLGDDGPKTARFAPAKSPRTVPNPKKKQATYPGRKKMNYAV